MRVDQLDDGELRVSVQVNKKYSLMHVFNLGQLPVSPTMLFLKYKWTQWPKICSQPLWTINWSWWGLFKLAKRLPGKQNHNLYSWHICTKYKYRSPGGSNTKDTPNLNEFKMQNKPESFEFIKVYVYVKRALIPSEL